MLYHPKGRAYLPAILALVCAICCTMASADPAPDPSAFVPVPTSGVSLSPLFNSGELSYTVALDSDAYITLNSVEYPITLIWSVFAVNRTGLSANNIEADGSDIGDWRCNTKPTNGTYFSVAGWFNASKSEGMVTPSMGSVSKAFDYSQFDYAGVDPLFGLHVSVAVPDGAPMPFGLGVTGPIIVTVPEPSSIVALLTGVVGLAGLLLRLS